MIETIFQGISTLLDDIITKIEDFKNDIHDLENKIIHNDDKECNRILDNTLPNHSFLWGTGTSAFQIEGSKNGKNRGKTIWDTFVEELASKNAISGNADIACNSFNQYKDDIQSVLKLGANSYRFSIAWSRIFPKKTSYNNSDIGIEGVRYYNNIINECLKYKITPVVTLYHWDLPQYLENDPEINGWLCHVTNGKNNIQKIFEIYADTCFRLFGDRVKNWCTINEPHTISTQGYQYNWFAPGLGTSDGNSVDGKEYIVTHNLLLSHAYAVKIYREKYNKSQNGKIGIVSNMDWAEPYSDSEEDKNAAENYSIFWFGWFNDPIFFGDYPKVMKELVGDRLPKFTEDEKKILQGSLDVIFLNSYSSLYAKFYDYAKEDNLVGWYYDSKALTSYIDQNGNLIGAETQSGWLHIVPWGIKKILKWIQKRYPYDSSSKSGIGIKLQDGSMKKIPLIISEQGMDIKDQDIDSTYLDCKNDKQRYNDYYKPYLQNISEAIEETGIDFIGYFPWSLLDNFEWASAYNCRFGLFYLDFNEYEKTGRIERQPKNSVKWFRNYIRKNPNGPNIINTHRR